MAHLLVFGDDKTQEQSEQFNPTAPGSNGVPLALSSSTTAAQLQRQPAGQVVVVSSASVPISQEQTEALCQFVQRGGGVLVVGQAAEAWREQDLYP